MFCLWIANLAFSVTPDLLVKFICKEALIENSCVKRCKMPKTNGQNKGFAYVTLDTEEASIKVKALTEIMLEGRRILIKDGDDYERNGKTDYKSSCLFLGNLSFETNEEMIGKVFPTARKIRVATFEDSGRCKGFAYVDFYKVEEAVESFESLGKKGTKCKIMRIDNRNIKVEYAGKEATMRGRGEFESIRNGVKEEKSDVKRNKKREYAETAEQEQEQPQEEEIVNDEPQNNYAVVKKHKNEKYESIETEKSRKDQRRQTTKRPAQPLKFGKRAIENFQGKKITFQE